MGRACAKSKAPAITPTCSVGGVCRSLYCYPPPLTKKIRKNVCEGKIQKMKEHAEKSDKKCAGQKKRGQGQKKRGLKVKRKGFGKILVGQIKKRGRSKTKKVLGVKT